MRTRNYFNRYDNHIVIITVFKKEISIFEKIHTRKLLFQVSDLLKKKIANPNKKF